MLLETIPFISSNLGYRSPLIDLHSVHPPKSIEGHGVSDELIECQSHIAWDDLCNIKTNIKHNALVEIAIKKQN